MGRDFPLATTYYYCSPPHNDPFSSSNEYFRIQAHQRHSEHKPATEGQDKSFRTSLNDDDRWHTWGVLEGEATSGTAEDDLENILLEFVYFERDLWIGTTTKFNPLNWAVSPPSRLLSHYPTKTDECLLARQTPLLRVVGEKICRKLHNRAKRSGVEKRHPVNVNI